MTRRIEYAWTAALVLALVILVLFVVVLFAGCQPHRVDPPKRLMALQLTLHYHPPGTNWMPLATTNVSLHWTNPMAFSGVWGSVGYYHTSRWSVVTAASPVGPWQSVTNLPYTQTNWTATNDGQIGGNWFRVGAL